MKIALVFLLLAVSTSYGLVLQSKTSETQCLQDILKTDLESILSAVQNIFCTYENCKEREGTANTCTTAQWEILLEEVTVILKDAGCTVDWVFFNGQPTVEVISEAIGKALEIIRDAIRDIESKLNVEKPAFDLLCDVQL